MADWELDDLERWDAKIRELVAASGLDPFPQEFEICDSGQMLGYMAYSAAVLLPLFALVTFLFF